MTLLSRTGAIGVLLALVGLGLHLQADTSSRTGLPDPVLERFAVANDGDLLLLPVELAGKRYLFFLDAGCSKSVYDSSFRHLLGNPIRIEEVKTVDKNISVPVFEAPDAKLGKFSLRSDSSVICTDLSRLRSVTGQEVYGVIGMDFLGKQVFRLDPDRKELVFLQSAGQNPGRRLAVSWVEHLPYIEVTVAGLSDPQQFMVDTGCGGFLNGSISYSVFQAVDKAGRLKQVGSSLFESASGTGTDQRAQVEAITIAGNRHENLIFGDGSRNILGLNYWLRSIVTFDFPNSAMYLKKSQQFEQPNVLDRSGLHILRVNGQTTVGAVDKESPAALAGIKPQDVILKVGNHGAEEMPLRSLRLLLCAQGKKVDLTIQREAKELRIPFVLRD